jgi:hypothetical protein
MRSLPHRLLAFGVALVALALGGCVVAVPLAIYYFTTPSEHVATAELPHPADGVYATVLREAQARSPALTIARREDAKREIEITDGVQRATVKVIGEATRETQIIVTANRVGRSREEEISLRILLHLCREYGDDCRVQAD